MRNKQLKIFWSTFKTHLINIEWILRWTRSSRRNWPRKTIELFTAKSPPKPIHLEENLIVKLFSMMHKCSYFSVVPFPKYVSPIFAQRKPNGKLRLLADLRKIKSLTADEYANNNHTVSTFSDAAQHLAGKFLFCKLDWSQIYHCLRMADQRSVEMLAFNFVSGTFAYKRLAQGLNRSVLVFSRFMREYLEPGWVFWQNHLAGMSFTAS